VSRPELVALADDMYHRRQHSHVHAGNGAVIAHLGRPAGVVYANDTSADESFS
jgi:hypothetical protein